MTIKATTYLHFFLLESFSLQSYCCFCCRFNFNFNSIINCRRTKFNRTGI